MKKIKSYPLTHQIGFISIEKELKPSMIKGDLGIQIAEDGKIWICLNGEALIRFKPTMHLELKKRICLVNEIGSKNLDK